jgi:endonuclease-3 related protein
MSKKKTPLFTIYTQLLYEFGRRDWWPADTSFEVIIGAILTQSVSWKNVKIAINNLKDQDLLDPAKLHKIETDKLAPLIRSSRFYNQKAKKIKTFLDFFFVEYNGDLSIMSKENPILLRKKLLAIKGLGEETVDSILLYACNKPFFVVDAYTKRIFSRFGLIDEKATYSAVQEFFMENLTQDIELYNDFHAQIVHLGHLVCKTTPTCDQCPIRKINEKVKCRYYLENFSTGLINFPPPPLPSAKPKPRLL